MCFNNLPIEFDDAGRARLTVDTADPFSLTAASPRLSQSEADRQAQIERLLAANGHVKDLNMDPVT
ncbi:MAG TPA: hypothetical protein VFO65_08640, partial [Acidimicrobiales bacterium]|nr:hypothetical protein [Acidimicrobiales bacterium]